MPEPPSSKRSAPATGDALDRLIDAIGTVTDEVRDLSKDTRITNASIRSIRTSHASLEARVDDHESADAKFHADLKEKAEIAARGLRRHDSGFRQTSEVDAKHASELAALVIALDDTRKISKKCLEEVADIKKAQVINSAETAAQTPMLAKVDTQTKQMSTPTKAAALLNLVIGVVYLVCEILKALGKHP